MVTMADILQLSGDIAQRFRSLKIILFGSRAYGHPREDSDVDLMVIMPYRGRESEKAVDILMKTRPRFAVDLLVCRPGEVRRGYREYDPLMREALDKGKVVYERNCPDADQRYRVIARDGASSRAGDADASQR